MSPAFLDSLGHALHGIGWAFLPFLLLPILCLIFPRIAFLSKLQFGVCQIIDGVNHWIGEAAKWLLPLMVVVVAFATIALSIFGQAWTKFDESAIYFHATAILLGSAATLLAGQHVRVDIFHAKMSPRAKALVDILGFYALLIPFCLALIWNAQNFIGLAWTSLEGSAESDGIRGIFLLKTFVSVFALMMLMQGLSLAGRAALFIQGNPIPDLPRGIDNPFGEEAAESAHVEGGI